VAIRLLNKIVERILSKTTYDGLTNTSPCKKANDDYVPYYQDRREIVLNQSVSCSIAARRAKAS
jgi:hypothetical protein